MKMTVFAFMAIDQTTSIEKIRRFAFARFNEFWTGFRWVNNNTPPPPLPGREEDLLLQDARQEALVTAEQVYRMARLGGEVHVSINGFAAFGDPF